MTAILKMNPVLDDQSIEALVQQITAYPEKREMLIRQLLLMSRYRAFCAFAAPSHNKNSSAFL